MPDSIRLFYRPTAICSSDSEFEFKLGYRETILQTTYVTL